MVWISISEKYEASDDGHIRNKKTKKVLKEFVGKDGYVRTQFDGKTRLVHRVIALTFVASDVNRPFVNHKDGNKQNNSAENLEWCTRSENIQHAYDNGLNHGMKGTSNGRCKLKEADVLYIREKYIPFDKEFGAKALAKRFGVAPQTISAVITKQNWGDFNGATFVSGLNRSHIRNL